MSAEAPRAPTDNPSALPVGTRLGEFELRAVLGIGGFGIVYLAFDHALEREVAVKEYMPASLAGRTETMHVSLRSQADADTFTVGLKSFVNEARLLAHFDHPALLKVHRFWEANGTAYMAMPVMRGRTVKELRQAMTTPPAEAWLRGLLDPLLGAIERLHSEGVYHRDIAPDNIQIEPDGHPVLLDFGAARRVISDKTQTLTAILKPAYAPIEQYAEAGSVRQGPWTDLYSLGATLHFLMLGRPPPPATARAVHDETSALTPQALPDISENFLLTVDWMLAPRPADRPQSVAALREVLEGRALPPRRRAPEAAASSQWDQTVLLPPVAASPRMKSADPATIVVPPTKPPAPGPAATRAAPAASAPPSAAPPPTPVAARRSSKLPLGIGLGVLAVVAVGAVVLRPWATQEPGPEPAASAAVAASAPALASAMPASAAASVASTASAALPAMNAAPESHIATVVVPVRRPTIETHPEAAAHTPAPKPAATHPKVEADRVAATHKTTNSVPSALPAAASTPPPAVVGAASAPSTARSQRQPASAPAVVAAAPVASAAAVPATPEGRCAGLNVLRHFGCMERECVRSEFRNHPDCLKWHQAARSQ